MTEHPRLPGRLARADDVRDRADAWPVDSSVVHYETSYLSLSHETVVGPDGDHHERAVVRPNGAVAVLALDEDDRVLLVEQYRHAVGLRMSELPAGTLDVEGEEPAAAAARELAEEGDVKAGSWETMLSMAATPGYSSERWQVFRATDLTPVPPAERTERQAEEAEIRQWWLPFPEAVRCALAGDLGDALSVAAILAEQVRRTG